MFSILLKDRSALLPWNWKYSPSKNLKICLSPKYFSEELLISSENYFALFHFLAIKTFSLKLSLCLFLADKTLTFLPSQEISHVWKSCSSSKGDWGKTRILAELKILNYKFSFTQVLPVSHLCAHLPHSHHVLDIILDQTRGESFRDIHISCLLS